MSTKGVLLALADHADNDGTCWPGVKSVAEKCQMSNSTVRYHLRVLRNKGLLLTEERKRADGSFTSNIYHLPIGISTHTRQDIDPYPSSVTPYPITSDSIPSEPLIDRNPQGTVIEPPQFIKVFLTDGRFTLPTESWIRTIEEEYGDLNLELAAHACLEWLQTNPKGRKRKGFKGSFTTWLQNLRNPPLNPNGSNPARATRAEILSPGDPRYSRPEGF